MTICILPYVLWNETINVASLIYIFIDKSYQDWYISQCFQTLKTFEYEPIILLKRYSHYNTKTIPLL